MLLLRIMPLSWPSVYEGPEGWWKNTTQVQAPRDALSLENLNAIAQMTQYLSAFYYHYG